jgi:tripartite-type tricarboxylate transporter receptor subunit TctC
MKVRGTPLSIGRPFGLRPGTPADRVAILRESLSKALADPKFLADTQNLQLEVGHIGADEVTKAFNAMIKQPPQVLEAMHKYLKASGD